MPGFFDFDQRLQRLSDIGDQLEAYAAAVDFEIFRSDLDAALGYTSGSQGGRPPFGGIQTHPDSGRTKLNLPFMRPNLAYLDVNSGAMLDVVALPGALRMNSLRHVAIDATGRVAVAAQ